jgi:hypothetical protein
MHNAAKRIACGGTATVSLWLTSMPSPDLCFGVARLATSTSRVARILPVPDFAEDEAWLVQDRGACPCRRSPTHVRPPCSL